MSEKPSESSMTAASDPVPDDPAPDDGWEDVDATAARFAADEPIVTLDANDVHYLFRAAHDWMARHYESVNRLNVFPVPDGDTGTNLLLTLKAALAAVAHSEKRAGAVIATAATGAHHGSRGNSGVIFGQMLQGWSQALATREKLTVRDLAEALQRASDVAYASVPSPVEGTILTVGRAVSQAAAAAALHVHDVREFLRQVVEAADVAVRRTPELLPVLREAGVVDSGGKGLFFIYEGMYRALTGSALYVQPDAGPADVVEAETTHLLDKGRRPLPPVRWGFDVQFLVEQPNKPLPEILADISAMGDYPLVEGDADIVKVHVHVFDPGMPLSYGVQLGFMSDVVVENMDDMAAAAHIGGDEQGGDEESPDTGEDVTATAARPPETLSLAANLPTDDDVGIVAVAPGPGFVELFHALGAHAVVRGGQTMNPSVADLRAAMDALPSRRLVVLPNNRNILMAAHQAAALWREADAARTVVVPASTTLPQGIAALVAWDHSAPSLDALEESMGVAMQLVTTGEVTRAVRDATVDGVAVSAGSVIGLMDGALVIAAESIAAVVDALLARMVRAETEVITIYRGEQVGEHAGENLAEALRDRYPELDIELAYGGQPYYDYILSAE